MLTSPPPAHLHLRVRARRGTPQACRSSRSSRARSSAHRTQRNSDGHGSTGRRACSDPRSLGYLAVQFGVPQSLGSQIDPVQPLETAYPNDVLRDVMRFTQGHHVAYVLAPGTARRDVCSLRWAERVATDHARVLANPRPVRAVNLFREPRAALSLELAALEHRLATLQRATLHHPNRALEVHCRLTLRYL